ncbi:MAG TPA: hypothetical protein VGR21_02735 [Cryptosporangiaceae bacterium]|nr:hypothetical protein [Cryptosporangiaceae bacterium]
MTTPGAPARRPGKRYGYFALPVLHHDRLAGKLGAKPDRRWLPRPEHHGSDPP